MMAMAGKHRNVEFLVWLTVLALILRGMSVCSARPLLDSVRTPSTKSTHEDRAAVPRTLLLHPHSNDNNVVDKGLFKYIFAMLPKGTVPPSGPSPIHNAVPTNSVAGQP